MWIMSFLLNFFRAILLRMLQILSLSEKTVKNTLSIYVKTNTGSTLNVELDPKWEIKNVKEIVAEKLGLQSAELKIIFAGKELPDSTTIAECDLGQQSILHAIKTRPVRLNKPKTESTLAEEETPEESSSSDLPVPENKTPDNDQEMSKANFFVHCGQCYKLCRGKLRVRCVVCKGGAFTVHRDPENWDDVLKSKRIRGHCESGEIACVDNDIGDPPFAEFYFKCGEHPSRGETDYAAPLNLIKNNFMKVPCLACTDVCDTILVFPCESKHVTCVECFKDYCRSRLMDRQFESYCELGYTLSCPAGCRNSFIEEIHHFKLMTKDEYERYQRFATEEFVLQNGGILCPQPGCGMGYIIEPNCVKITCENGCGYVFCRNCLQGYHIGECLPDISNISNAQLCQFAVDPNSAADARWDETASNITIKVLTKPCPKCRTPTERDGGCMHMVCTRGGCGFEWCWVCQTEWTRDCMGAHWFG